MWGLLQASTDKEPFQCSMDQIGEIPFCLKVCEKLLKLNILSQLVMKTDCDCVSLNLFFFTVNQVFLELKNSTHCRDFAITAVLCFRPCFHFIFRLAASSHHLEAKQLTRLTHFLSGTAQ